MYAFKDFIKLPREQFNTNWKGKGWVSVVSFPVFAKQFFF